MSNLGWYQVMTTTAKKVGGPLKLAGLLFIGGAFIGGKAEAIKNKMAQKSDEKEESNRINGCSYNNDR